MSHSRSRALLQPFSLPEVTVTSAQLVGIGQSTPLGKLHVTQEDSAAAVPVLVLEQTDVDQDMIELTATVGTGNAVEAVAAKTLTTTHFVKVTLTGVGVRYFPIGTIA